MQAPAHLLRDEAGAAAVSFREWVADCAKAPGALLVLGGLAVLFQAVMLLRARDYLASIILVSTGMPLLRAGVELLRPSIGD